MTVENLSKTYRAALIEERDIPQVLELCRGNPQYYEHCPPYVSEASIRSDMKALPDGKTAEDKYYLGLWDGARLVAVLDLITKFPTPKSAFFGFFMVRADIQGSGAGSRMVDEAIEHLSEEFSEIRLGYVQGNEQSRHFWLKNGFAPTGIVTHTDDYDIVVMRREI